MSLFDEIEFNFVDFFVKIDILKFIDTKRADFSEIDLIENKENWAFKFMFNSTWISLF